jgi:hypothetical protein
MQQRIKNTERYRETRHWTLLLLRTQRAQNSPKSTYKHNDLASWRCTKLTRWEKGEVDGIREQVAEKNAWPTKEVVTRG